MSGSGNLVAGSHCFYGILVILSFALILGDIDVSLADDHGKVRIYKLNKHKQLVRQRWVKKAHIEGCHRLSKPKKVYRFAQSEYAYCTLFAGGECEQGTAVPAKWSGKKYRPADIDIIQPQIKLLPGSQWILGVGKNVEIQSWSCQYLNTELGNL